MIDLAKNSTARQLLEKQEQIENNKNYDEDIVKASLEDKTVKTPTLLHMGSNIIEALRLREELINRASEC